MTNETKADTNGTERIDQIQEVQESLRSLDWGEMPMSARRHAEIADDALTNAVQEVKADNRSVSAKPEQSER